METSALDWTDGKRTAMSVLRKKLPYLAQAVLMANGTRHSQQALLWPVTASHSDTILTSLDMMTLSMVAIPLSLSTLSRSAWMQGTRTIWLNSSHGTLKVTLFPSQWIYPLSPPVQVPY